MSGMKGVPCALTYVLGFLMPFLESNSKEINISQAVVILFHSHPPNGRVYVSAMLDD